MLKLNKLTEANLFEVLKVVYPTGEIIKQSRLRVNNKTMIVDYEIAYGIKVIYVEFDGPTHFTSAKTQVRDLALEKYCKENNVELIRIPYFVQLNKYTLSTYFRHVAYPEGLVDSEYKSGFIDPKITYPSSYNKYGWKLFFKHLDLIGLDAENIADGLLQGDTNITVGLGMDAELEKLSKYIYYEDQGDRCYE